MYAKQVNNTYIGIIFVYLQFIPGEAEILFSGCHFPTSFSRIMIVGSHVDGAGVYLDVSERMALKIHEQTNISQVA